MADAPWRCSECGTVNEPVANSCRTCGKWPSLFDLQESVYPESAPADVAEEAYEVETFETQPYEVEQHVPDQSRRVPPPTPEMDDVEGEPETTADRRRRLITSLIVPLAFVVYIVISIIFGDRGSG